MKKLLLPLLLLCGSFSFGQDMVKHTFSDTRIITAPSIETLNRGRLNFLVTHRFGDIASGTSNWENLFGFEQISDVRIGVEYGLLDKLLIGIGRSKGPHQLKAILDGYAKYRLLSQTADNKMPLSVALYGNVAFSSMNKRADTTLLSSFPHFSHRLTYTGQVIVARKFGERFSMALLPTLVHRNLVPFGDKNSIFFLGAGSRIGIARGAAILLEYFYPFASEKSDDATYHNPFGIGVELDTGGGHIFTFSFTNNKAILLNEALAYNQSDWLEGEFRWGFTILRKF